MRLHLDIDHERVRGFCLRIDLRTKGFLSGYFRDEVVAEAEVESVA